MQQMSSLVQPTFRNNAILSTFRRTPLYAKRLLIYNQSMWYRIFKYLAILIFLINIGMYSYIFSVHNAELGQIKQKMFGNDAEYAKLKEEYIQYKERTKNFRQIVIVANSAESKNVKVGDIINTYAKNVNGDVSIFYKNLTTDESVIVAGDKTYYMASLYKVILTLYILDRVQKGEISLTDKTPGSSVTVEQALQKIITESNNEYAIALAEQYGWTNVEAYMRPLLGIDFHFDKNLDTDVKNMGSLFEEISLSLKISRSETTYLLNLLGDQKRISKLPKYLPTGIYSHNKTGEYEQYSHDAGIFYTAKANYILIFMSKTPSPGTTNEQMAKMSLDIYNTLNEVK
ncbi:hypothetical protein BH11PAT1_BH11PAT1_3890 [soil metagenome]